MKTVFVEPNQNIIDICLQEFGSLDNLVQLHLTNGFTEYPQEIKAGDQVIIPDLPVSKAVMVIMQSHKPATRNDVILQQVSPGGINYMGIEIDFKIS